MKILLLPIAFAFWLGMSCVCSGQPPIQYQLDTDWLLDPGGFKAQVIQHHDSSRYELSNGLIRRQFLVVGDKFTTIGFDNLATGQTLIRSIRPDASVTIDGQRHAIGGILGQQNHAFLRQRDIDELEFDPDAMKLVGVEFGEPQARFAWKQIRHHAPDVSWPPRGKSIRFNFVPAEHQGLKSPLVSLHYEIYDGIPLLAKWLTVSNRSDQSISVDRFVAETLALIEHSNHVETRQGAPLPKPESLYVETDMAFGSFKADVANRHAVHYQTDPAYKTQVNYLLQQPCLLTVAPTYGPAQKVPAGGTFESFRVFELAMDSTDRERRGLAIRRMYRTVAPWVTENPLMHHLLESDPEQVKQAIDQAAEVGFEMVILSFGSGFNAENRSPEYLNRWRELASYAAERNIDLGCYSLYSSRRIGNGNDIVPPEGQSLTHGNCPAITSPWGQAYLKQLYHLFETTGFTVFENDGPYPGDVDMTPRPPWQAGEQDSRWVHWRQWTQFYQFLRGQGVYLNAPDYYYLAGSNKCGMGYREVNWSLPREQQLIHTRQNIFDGTWTKTPSMGWMFVPLSEYHGGGAAATIEPLDQHLDHYRLMIQSNLANGVQACYRGPRLFDTERVKQMLQSQVQWFKQHRGILESDVIHLRRADGQRLDGLLHVNPQQTESAMLCVFNPTDQPLTETWTIPLYYAGLASTARISIDGDASNTIELDRFSRAQIKLRVPANGFQWIVFQTDETTLSDQPGGNATNSEK